jgi:predicted GNAT family acetyltransferase
MIAGSILFIWEDAYPVSMAAAVREVTDCRFIGHVYTPPISAAKDIQPPAFPR